MVENSIEDIRRKAIAEIKEKIKKNLKHAHPCSKEFQEDMKRLKFENGNKYISWMLQNGILIDSTYDSRIKNKNCTNYKEYKNKCAQDLGFKNRSEYVKIWRWEKGIQSPMMDEDSSLNFGVHKGEAVFEKFLLTIFEYVEHMRYGNKGFDFICKNPRQEFIVKYPQFKLETNKEYKIQLKISKLYNYKGSFQWIFGIEYNNIADCFILAAFDDRENFNPMYTWLFYKDEMVRKGNSYTIREKFWKRDSFTITNNPKYLKIFEKNELPMEKLKELCKKY